VAKKTRTPKPPRAPRPGGRQVQAPQRRAGTTRKPPVTASTQARSRYFWPAAAGVVALAILATVLGVVLTRSSGKSTPPALALTTPIVWAKLPGLQRGKPPWPNNSKTLIERLPYLGLNALTQEQLAFHIHQHLDIYLNGQHVTVPQWVGFGADPTTGQLKFLTELHTHNSSGIIHVESGKNLRYQLGQFMGEWGIRLTTNCLGSFNGSCDGLHWYLNGVRQTGNPAKLVLKNHQEIAIVVGKPPATIPTSYDFGAHGL
jgi:hypothetical protein